MLNETNKTIVARCFLFRNLDEAAYHNIWEAGHERQFQQGSFLFHQGGESTWMYVVLVGRVKLTQVTHEGEQVVVNYFGPGQGLGIIMALNNSDYPLSAEAIENCEVIGWHRDEMKALMLRYPVLALNGMKMMGERFTQLQARFSDISTKHVEQRVARALLRLVRQFGQQVEEGVLIDIPLSRQDVAEMTGTNLYNVSRIVHQWELKGWIVSHRKQIIVCQAHKLVMLAEDLAEEVNHDEECSVGGMDD